MLGFAEDLLSLRSTKRDRSKNYRGAEARDHGAKRAEEILRIGLEAFGISESELPELKKSSDEKFLIASIIRTETAVPIAWVAETLQMGTAANLTRAGKAIEGRLEGNRKLKQTKKRIYANISS